MKNEIEESKIIELIKSFEDGRSMQVEALALANARTEEQMKNAIDRLSEFNVTLTEGMKSIRADIKELDGRFASKLVEKIVYTVSGAFLLAMVGAIIFLVLPNKAQAFGLFLVNITN